MKGYPGTHLRIVQTNTSTYSRTKASPGTNTIQEADTAKTTEGQRVSSAWASSQRQENGSRKMKMQSTRRLNQERRLARVEELRELVRSGHYRVDSMTLAQSMLDNETHFMTPPQHS